MQEPPVRKVYNMGAEFQIRYHPSYPTSQLVLGDLQSTKLHCEKNFITWNFAQGRIKSVNWGGGGAYSYIQVLPN